MVGTAWAYWKLRDKPSHASHRIDWGGNVCFGLGLILILTAITYGLQPYGDQVMAWTSPKVLMLFAIGTLALVAFVLIERRIATPMLDLKLFRISAFAYGNLANLASGIARGGLQFMLITFGCKAPGCRCMAIHSSRHPCGLPSSCCR